MKTDPSHIDVAAIFLGSRVGPDAAFEARVSDSLHQVAAYLVERDKKILYGGGEEGHAKDLFDFVKKRGGQIDNVLPKFYEQLSVCFLDAASLEYDDLDASNIAAMLEFKHNFLSQAKAKFAFPGATGTLSEIVTSMERADVSARFDLDVPLAPIIVLNINGYYDGLKIQVERMIAQGRLHPSRANMIFFANNADQAIAAFEAYEKMGACPAARIEHFHPGMLEL